MSFDLAHIWAQTSPVNKAILIILVIMGIAALYVGIERLVTLNKARAQSRALAARLTDLFHAGDVRGALDATREPAVKHAYLGHLLEVGLAELADGIHRHTIDAARRAMDRRAIQESADLRRGMNILATTGSTAPFVGLVGTVIGIINAFAGMAETGSGGLGAVAAGIAEALVATALGISVAITGVWLFNYFTGRIDAITNDITVSIDEFVDWCEKQLLKRGDDATEATEAAR